MLRWGLENRFCSFLFSLLTMIRSGFFLVTNVLHCKSLWTNASAKCPKCKRKCKCKLHSSGFEVASVPHHENCIPGTNYSLVCMCFACCVYHTELQLDFCAISCCGMPYNPILILVSQRYRCVYSCIRRRPHQTIRN